MRNRARSGVSWGECDGAAALVEEHASSAGLQVPDALIAATALERGATLATANARHFRAVPKLQVKTFRMTAR
jgi:predicted nucleic acid-binding protein